VTFGGLVRRLLCFLFRWKCDEPGPFGRFVGTVKTEWIDPDREMKLLEDFAYVDRTGVAWMAPAGSLIDGASIPRVLWTVVGSPFTGSYRNASVVHDVACTERVKPWQEVHRMFHDACRCGGSGEVQAKILFAAVYHFGPRWSVAGASVAVVRTKPVLDEFRALEAFISARNPSLDEIERFGK
jgi:hypothetical protein